MDMKINSSKIIKLRRQRAWSQQQLADIACVSMRTIQRVESSNRASQESVKAIATAFDIKAADLIESETSKKLDTKLTLTAILLLAGGLLSSVLFIANANAQSLMIKVQVTSNDQQTDVQLVQDSGQKSEMIFDDEFRVEITPSVLEDKKIYIKTRIFEINEFGGSELIASPSVITEHRTKATIRFETTNMAHYDIDLTPHL